jgi:hypothetical protein
VARLAGSAFWGWRGGVRPVADHRQQGKGEHHQRDVAVPAVPAARLIVVQSQLGLGGLERVLDRPAAALDPDQHRQRRALWAPGGEERQASVGQAAPDQQPARPHRGAAGIAHVLRLEVGQLQVGPIVKPWSLGAVTGRETHPGRCRQAGRDRLRRAAPARLLAPGPEWVCAGDPEHVAFAGAAQDLLDLAHAVDAVRRCPGEGDARLEGPLDHRDGDRRLGGEAHVLGHMSGTQTVGLVGPALGQVEPAIEEGMTPIRHVSGEHADLTVGDLARRAGVLPLHAAGGGALLEKAGLVDHQHGIRCRQGLEGIVAHQITQRVGLPTAAAEHGLLPPGAGIARRLGTHPAGLAPLRPEQPVEERRGGGRHAGMIEQRPHPRLGRAQLGRPEVQRLFDRGTRHQQLPPS